MVSSLIRSIAAATLWSVLALTAVYAQTPAERTALWQEALKLRGRLRLDSADRQTALRAAELEIAIGMPARALPLLEKHIAADSTLDMAGVILRGAAEYALNRFEAAAGSFALAAELAEPPERGVLSARAGRAFEQAGLLGDASELYADAAEALPQFSPWLAVRRAAVSDDTTHAFRLLAEAPAELKSLASRVRGFKYAAAGDTVTAIRVLEAGGHIVEAAELALSFGDSISARRFAYRALEADDTSTARAGLVIVQTNFPPSAPADFLGLAAASRSLRSTGDAARYAGAAVAAGDSSPETLLLWGDLLNGSRSLQQALAAYRRAAAMHGDAAEHAAFQYGRVLLNLGRGAEGMAQLRSHIERFPDHETVPRALYGMADRRRREGRIADSDSLNEIIARRWPRDYYASSARMAMAADALERGDTTTTIKWYRAEIEFRGNQRNVAQYRLGRIRAAAGDTVSARAIWAALARADSLGYYGMIARTAANMSPMVVEPGRTMPEGVELREIFSVLSFLADAYLVEEHELVLESLRDGATRAPPELLSLGEGLIARGYVREGIHIGWLASRSYTLNHPRVLRIVYPWPYRELIEQTAKDLSLDPHLLAALIRQESAFTPGAVSRAGAYGLMQLMPPTAREVARRIGAEWSDVLLTVADANLHLGATHLAGLLRHYDGRVVPTLAAYNAGATPVRRWLRSFGLDDAVQFVERVPYTETRGYLRTVLRNWDLYRALYPPDPEGVTGGR